MVRGLNRGTLAAAARAARRHATPFYLFDPEALARAARAWRDVVRDASPAAVFYPYKCNRSREAVARLARERLGAEVTTAEDFRLAWKLGVPAGAIVVQGPAKTGELLDAAISAGALLVADGPEDAEAILARARASSAAPRYLLRLAPRAATREQRPFGMAAKDLVAAASEIARRRAPAPLGLAFHLGTGIASAEPYLRALAETADVARALERVQEFRTDPILDLGGGFAATEESRLDAKARPLGTARAPAGHAARLAREARRLLGSRTTVLFEPGRALVSGAFHLVARVVRVREGPRPTVYLDASRASHAFFAGRGDHPIAALPRRAGRARRATLAGPLGVELDVFARDLALLPVRTGDLVVIGSVGAYNQNAASGWAGAVPGVVSA